ncbi:hypothetical protein [Micromonospora aurantiaca]|uniref:hypothetical protein n=1 Tax=Micromonospora aurantiaca (nom. illeg.) TaxID=47850 RepID=UPI002E17A643
MAMKIEKELERVYLFRIGEPHRRFGLSGPVHRAPPDPRELGKLSGSGSPAIVAVWFAWWYLRPTPPQVNAPSGVFSAVIEAGTAAKYSGRPARVAAA